MCRFFKEEGRNPKQLDFAIGSKGGYPEHMEYRNTFKIDWSEILGLAGLNMDIGTKELNIICEICKCSVITTRKDRKICNSKKCRYVRDMLLKTKYNKKKYPFSIFHHVSYEVLKKHYEELYDLRKEHIRTTGVV